VHDPSHSRTGNVKESLRNMLDEDKLVRHAPSMQGEVSFIHDDPGNAKPC